ncbi:single-stranded DNA-binding protein [Streptacidiphilus sp. PAMC 29251]
MSTGETPITIVGNLTADPELTFTPGGAAWARFVVASTPRSFDKTTNQWTDGTGMFLRCSAWRDLAEHVAESLTKGTRVIVTGRLRQNDWTTPEGDKRSALVIEVDEIGPSLRFANATITRAQRNGSSGPAAAPAEDPWASSAPVPQNPAHAATGASGGGFSDEPPF